MPLHFQPKARAVVMCDFSGFVVPEMVKVRPVVVLARNRQSHKLVTVVPLSTTKPQVLGNQHHQFVVNPLPDKPRIACWAKCDMVYTVSIDRLDRYKLSGGRFVVPMVSAADFEAVRAGVVAALKLADN